MVRSLIHYPSRIFLSSCLQDDKYSFFIAYYETAVKENKHIKCVLCVKPKQHTGDMIQGKPSLIVTQMDTVLFEHKLGWS